MKNLIKRLPVLALALVALAAFAFTQPEQASNNVYGYDPVQNEWYDITGLQEGVEFQCNLSFQEDCKYSILLDLNSAIDPQDGRFVPGPELEPIEM